MAKKSKEEIEKVKDALAPMLSLAIRRLYIFIIGRTARGLLTNLPNIILPKNLLTGR